MLGDFRSSNDTNYHYFDPACIDANDLVSTRLPWRIQQTSDDNEASAAMSADESRTIDRTRSCSITWSDEEILKAQKIWKSILAYTNDVLGKMEALAQGSKGDSEESRPLLSDFLVLVEKAHALPTPEEAFGRRDPSARVMSQNMNAVLDAIETGRDCAAKLLKCLKDDGEGIELDALKKSVDEIEQVCPVQLPEIVATKRQITEASMWEEKVQSNVDCVGGADSDVSDGDVLLEKKLLLEKVERLVSKGKNLTLRPRSLVRLENRIERAHVLRRKINVWNEARNQENPQNIKFIAAMLKEANKIDLMFPEILTLTGVHKKAEEWMDRASVAVRTTISFDELESLVTTGEGLPLNVSDVLEKLQNRKKQAIEWTDRVKEIVPNDDGDCYAWLKCIRRALDDSDKYGQLISLLSEGSRIPVDMDCMKLLQIEIDARNWSIKAKPWIPLSMDASPEDKTYKRGKLDDVHDHIGKASSLRDRLWFAKEDDSSKWVLEGESELNEMIDMADAWFDEVSPFNLLYC